MRTLTLYIIILFFIVLSLPFLSADNIIKITPLEELYSSSNFILDIKQMILSRDEYTQLKALNALEKVVAQDLYGSIKMELVSILHYLCTTPPSSNSRAHNLCIRKKGIELIRRLGMKSGDRDFSRLMEYILITQLARETDISCASSIIYSLGMIGSDNTKTTIPAITSAVDTWTRQTRDKAFTFAVITAIENIAHKNDGIREQEVYTTLIKIMQSSNDDQLIQKSLEVMNILVTYSNGD